MVDLGSGDGCLVIAAAKELGMRGVGIELNPWLVWWARAKARWHGVSSLCTFHTKVPLGEAKEHVCAGSGGGSCSGRC